jgi:DNA invertase Pin-like site-specific DNA recombinase
MLMNDSPEVPVSTKAAEYVRMSTEHQQYSTQNQSDRIREYAERRGLNIVRTYADEGKSGLRIEGRIALQRLLQDVESGNAGFSIVLVYDVSRWGRFQDADESAYYEYRCKKSGIQVVYCAEQFENDGSPVSTIVKGVKRAMAGEYSRELSTKVFAGQCRLVELGYRQGGLAGFGLRRMLLDQGGESKGLLKLGEQKCLQTDRVKLVPGPENEVHTVRKIYAWFIDGALSEVEIADKLNATGTRTQLGRAWTRGTVHEVLTNEKYIGSNVYNRISFKLKKARVSNPSEMWIRKEEAFPALVTPDMFYTARGMIRARARRFSDVELVARLKGLFAQRGLLSGLIIDETDGMPSSSVYAHRFGSLLRAYQAVGFTPTRDYSYLEINRLLRRLHPKIVEDAEQKIQDLGARLRHDAATDLISVNDEFSVSMVLCRCRRTGVGRLRWKICFDTSLSPDITIAVRLREENDRALDYFLFPQLAFEVPKVRLAERNGIELESFRFDTLDYFFGMAEHIRLRRAA